MPAGYEDDFIIEDAEEYTTEDTERTQRER
jgi:hypothetical protein